ncbi:hypothetical protein JZ751_020261 [Albula glossodonta]|uniref:Uncharacterized protein n=1 Tax=Albula glossodonta TaxID=121402 RepID=A0A8T2MTX0_9TELE|nr:hypothetical protein JZ751_020261 [Albula glossodonta]
MQPKIVRVQLAGLLRHNSTCAKCHFLINVSLQMKPQKKNLQQQKSKKTKNRKCKAKRMNQKSAAGSWDKIRLWSRLCRLMAKRLGRRRERGREREREHMDSTWPTQPGDGPQDPISAGVTQTQSPTLLSPQEKEAGYRDEAAERDTLAPRHN